VDYARTGDGLQRPAILQILFSILVGCLIDREETSWIADWVYTGRCRSAEAPLLKQILSNRHKG